MKRISRRSGPGLKPLHNRHRKLNKPITASKASSCCPRKAQFPEKWHIAFRLIERNVVQCFSIMAIQQFLAPHQLWTSDVFTRAQSCSKVKSAIRPQVCGANNFLEPSTVISLGPGLQSAFSVENTIRTIDIVIHLDFHSTKRAACDRLILGHLAPDQIQRYPHLIPTGIKFSSSCPRRMFCCDCWREYQNI